MTARKRSLRKLDTRNRRPTRARAREIFDAPVIYNGNGYTEVHVLVDWGGWVLTLYDRNHPIGGSARPIGLHGLFEPYRAPVDVNGLWHEAERLVALARSGDLTRLDDHTWIGCLV